jgi:hypothetical protein
MRVPLGSRSLTFCSECGTRLQSTNKPCPRCGNVIPQADRPVAVMVFLTICALSAVFIVYTLAFKAGGEDEKPRTTLTLTELDLFVPSGWQYREVNGAYVMAQYKEDLDVDDPESLRGPQLRMAREPQARSNVQREVTRGILKSDIQDAPRDDTYGQASELTGTQVRFVREGVDTDVVGFRYYMTGSNPLGQAYTIAYFVPATIEKKYEATVRTFLSSLSLTEEDTE